MCAFLAHPTPFTNVAQHRATRNCARRRPPFCTLSRPPAPSFSAPDDRGGNAAVPLEDRNVPASHKGLHETLYGDNAENVHGAGTSVSEGKARFEDVGTTLYEIDAFVGLVGTEKVAGVYRVLNSEQQLVFVGMGRNIALSLQAHQKEYGAANVAHVQVKTFRFPKRAEMEETRDAWIAENGEIPVGNQEPHWGKAKASLRTEVMTPQERAAFEETKFKLRKAMADPSLHMEPREGDGQLSSEDIRRAVEDDDWSSEINRQSQEVVAAQEPETIVSPFANASNREAAGRVPGAPDAELLELSQANVDAVLDSVRPYLLSDGGNVSVVSVNATSGDVVLQLEGACGTCPSATMTMQMGIERALKNAFGNKLVSVSAISDPASAHLAVLSVEVCDAILDAEVRPAIAGLGGSVDVISAADGHIELRYAGPDKLAYGIELILREKAPNVQAIVFQK